MLLLPGLSCAEEPPPERKPENIRGGLVDNYALLLGPASRRA